MAGLFQVFPQKSPESQKDATQPNYRGKHKKNPFLFRSLLPLLDPPQNFLLLNFSQTRFPGERTLQSATHQGEGKSGGERACFPFRRFAGCDPFWYRTAKGRLYLHIGSNPPPPPFRQQSAAKETVFTGWKYIVVVLVKEKAFRKSLGKRGAGRW